MFNSPESSQVREFENRMRKRNSPEKSKHCFHIVRVIF